MTNYAGLPAGDAIALWRQNHQILAKKYGIDLTNTDPKYLMSAMSKMSQEDSYEFTPYNIQTQNPAAFKIFRTGMDSPGDKKTRQILNPLTGDWENQDKHGLFSHWETWFQLAAGGAIGGFVAAPYIAAAMAGSAAPATATGIEAAATMGIPGAVTTAGIVAPEALTLGGAAAAGGIPTAVTTAAVSGGGAATKPVVDAVAASDPYTSQIPPGSERGPGNFDVPDYTSQIPPGSERGPVDYDSVMKKAKDAGISQSLLDQLMKSGVGPAGISALTTLIGTHMANSAASDAAKTQADALKYSTDVQDAAAKRNEAFLRQQSQSAYLNSEATRRANYDQWRAREGRVSTLGAALGLGERNIPAYVPGVDPRFTVDTTTTTIPGRAAGGPVDQGKPYVVGENGPEVVVPNQNGTVMPNDSFWNPPRDMKFAQISGAWDPNVFGKIVGRPPTQAETAYYSQRGSDWVKEVQGNTPGGGGAPYDLPQTTGGGGGGGYDALMQALTSNYQSLGATPTGPGTGPTDISYFARRIQETGGMTPQNQAYWFGPKGRIAMELAGAVPPEGAASTPANVPGGAGPGGAPDMTKQSTYDPGSLGDIVRRTNYWWS